MNNRHVARCLLSFALAAMMLTAVIMAGCSNAKANGENNSFPPETSTEASTTSPEITSTPMDTAVPSLTPSYTPELTQAAISLPTPDDEKLNVGEITNPVRTPEPFKEMNYVEGYVNEQFVNLRAEPSMDADILKTFPLGTSLYVTGRNDEWFRVEIGEYTGYMARPYVKLGYYETPKPTVKPTPKPGGSSNMYTVHEGQFNDYEIRLVAAIIHLEGPGSSNVAYRALASVVLNRVMNSSGNFPNNVEGVLFQKGQFGYSREKLESTTPNSAALAAAKYVFSSHGSTLPKKVLFYRASYLGIEWTSYTRFYATIGANNYYYGINYY